MAGPIINGVAYDFANVEVNVNGDTFVDVSKIDYSDPLEPGRQYGTHPQATSRSTGQLKPSASMTLAKATANAIRAKLGNGYKLVKFDVVVTYAAEGQDLITDSLKGVRIKDDKSSASGTDPLNEDWDLDPMSILRNGLSSIPNPLY